MTEFSLPHVSISSSGGEYFQILVAENEDSDDDYFLIQRQFESPHCGKLYVESHHRALRGHFKIRRAELRRGVRRLTLVCLPAKTVEVRFQVGQSRYNRLKNVLRIMLPSRVLNIE